MEENVIIFAADLSSSVHVDNKRKDILILGEGPTQGLDKTILIAEAKYPINFTESGKRFALSLHNNRSNSFLFVSATKVYHFNALFSGNISKDFTINGIKKTGLKGVANFFSVDFNPIDINDVLDILKYLMKRTRNKIMFGLIKEIFNGLFTDLANGSNHTKCVSLIYQKCQIQPSLISLNPN